MFTTKRFITRQSSSFNVMLNNVFENQNGNEIKKLGTP